MPNAIDELERLAVNWDGYGAVAIHADTIARARRILDALRAVGFDPEVTPNPNGTVSFEWDSVHIEVGRTRGVGVVK